MGAAFLASGAVSALTGIVLQAQLRIGQSTVGQEFLLPAFAAALLGATTIKPGRVNVGGIVSDRAGRDLPEGSHGRVTPAGEPFIRGSITMTGHDFDSSEIAFLGANPVDVERVAEVAPDLIVTSIWQTAPVDQLQVIAPTVVLDTTARETIGVFPPLAEATGTEDALERLETRYRAQIEQLRRLVPTKDIAVSVTLALVGWTLM